jgi:hypothetical protein
MEYQHAELQPDGNINVNAVVDSVSTRLRL